MGSFLDNFYGAMEQNVLKLFEALINDQIFALPTLPGPKENMINIIY